MKASIDEGTKIVPFEDLPTPQVEVFGIIRRPEDPPISSLLSWNGGKVEERPRTAAGKKSEWISESHDAFKSFTVVTPGQLLGNLGYQPRPIPETGGRPAEAGEEEGKKQHSGSPKSRERSLSHSPKPVSAKTPKGDQKGSQRQMERIKKLNQTTRWLPNSAFKTYFGKPIFANYGQGNTNPAYGGLMYGDYMKTHNIAPHEGANNPGTQQVYEPAESKALQKQAKPQVLPRKCKDEDRLPPDEVEKLKQRSQILSKPREKPSKTIVKPDLLKEKLFKSEHNTPNQSVQETPAKVKPGKEQKPIKEAKEKPKPGKKPSSEAKPSEVPIEPARILPIAEENKLERDQLKEEEDEKFEEAKSHDVEVQAEDCNECANRQFKKLVRTSYQDMTSKLTVDKNNQIVEPFKYCSRCRDELFNEDVMRPPYSLAEIPPQELNPKSYKTLPPQWTQRIPAAGKLSYRSPSAYNVIFGENIALGGQ